jgi:hypothetical protein
MKEAQLSQLPINAAAFLLSDDKPGTPRKAEGGRRKDKEKRTDLTFSFLSPRFPKKSLTNSDLPPTVNVFLVFYQSLKNEQ